MQLTLCGGGINVRYMSQISYGIPRICHVGFPRKSTQQLADFCELSWGSLQTSVNLPRNHRRLYVETLLGIHETSIRTCGMMCWRVAVKRSKEFAQRFTQGLRFQRTISLTPEEDFTDSIICGLPKIVWEPAKMSFRIRGIVFRESTEFSFGRTWIRLVGVLQDESTCARKTILWIPERRFRGSWKTILRAPTDDLRISANTFTEIRDGLLRKSAVFRK